MPNRDETQPRYAEQSLAREMGSHNARLDTLEKDVGEIKDDIKAILATLSEARGGWRALMIVAGISATLGAAMAKLAALIGIGIPPVR